ncbi:MAG: hypothetical protein KDC38_05045, partial [Planctomycetes bacterium]|nr:hypothetical protein [Planctomycetota bacterium]
LRDNQASLGGGASLLCCQSEVVISGCESTGNVANAWGGAILADGAASISVDTSLFAGNSSFVLGGVISTSVNGTPLTLDRCTFVGNSSDGGAILNLVGGSTADVRNSIIWGNGPGHFVGSPPTVGFSDVEGGFAGFGNIDVDPQFRDPDAGDYRLLPSSPCIDAGDPASPPDPDGSIADMGAFALIEPLFRRGDTNGDGVFDISDPVSALAALFIVGTPPPECVSAADVNDEGVFDISDVVYALAALFVPGAAPPPLPYPDCGIDLTIDGLGCDGPSCP